MVSSGLTTSTRHAAYAALWARHKAVYHRLDGLQRRLGHCFESLELLYEALTHRSALMELAAQPLGEAAASLPWNERLEFLGDSVLGLCVTSRIMRLSLGESECREGDLSRIRAAVVNETSLADAARRLELGQCLVLGKGASRSGGRERDSLLADALEAVVGAVFLDGGYESADELVGRLFEAQLKDDPRHLVQADFKTMLQELTQERLKQTPRYVIAKETGPDHDKRFEVQVFLGDEELGTGMGASKKRASQDAARQALQRLSGHSQGQGAVSK